METKVKDNWNIKGGREGERETNRQRMEKEERERRWMNRRDGAGKRRREK